MTYKNIRVVIYDLNRITYIRNIIKRRAERKNVPFLLFQTRSFGVLFIAISFCLSS